MNRRTPAPNLIAVGRWLIPTDSAEGGYRPEGRWQPATDIYLQRHSLVIRMEVAGVKADDLDIMVDGRLLRIAGERRDECPGVECEYRQVEITFGRFERVFEFPFPLGDATLTANIADGFLTVRVDIPANTPTRIPIEPGE